MEKTLREILGPDYSEGGLTKGSKAVSKVASNSQSAAKGESTNFEESEISVILEYVEEHYNSLYGHGTGTEFKAKKDKAWKMVVEEIIKSTSRFYVIYLGQLGSK